MIIRNVELETVCGVTSRLPENILPEFAFAGKSNVGKSSLINALMNRKALARTCLLYTSELFVLPYYYATFAELYAVLRAPYGGELNGFGYPEVVPTGSFGGTYVNQADSAGNGQYGGYEMCIRDSTTIEAVSRGAAIWQRCSAALQRISAFRLPALTATRLTRVTSTPPSTRPAFRALWRPWRQTCRKRRLNRP